MKWKWIVAYICFRCGAIFILALIIILPLVKIMQIEKDSWIHSECRVLSIFSDARPCIGKPYVEWSVNATLSNSQSSILFIIEIVDSINNAIRWQQERRVNTTYSCFVHSPDWIVQWTMPISLSRDYPRLIIVSYILAILLTITCAFIPLIFIILKLKKCGFKTTQSETSGNVKISFI